MYLKNTCQLPVTSCQQRTRGRGSQGWGSLSWVVQTETLRTSQAKPTWQLTIGAAGSERVYLLNALLLFLFARGNVGHLLFLRRTRRTDAGTSRRAAVHLVGLLQRRQGVRVRLHVGLEFIRIGDVRLQLCPRRSCILRGWLTWSRRRSISGGHCVRARRCLIRRGRPTDCGRGQLAVPIRASAYRAHEIPRNSGGRDGFGIDHGGITAMGGARNIGMLFQ